MPNEAREALDGITATRHIRRQAFSSTGEGMRNVAKILPAVLAGVIILLSTDAHSAPFGCGTKANWLLSDSIYSQAVATYCEGYLTAQSECKAARTWKRDGQGNISFDFSDWVVVRQFAAGHGLIPRCHALIWRDGNPSWIRNLSASQLRDAAFRSLAAAINAGAQHLEIVNEPEGGLGPYRVLGQGFIGDLYRYARQRCSSCTLAINFFTNPSLSYLQGLKAEGIPIDVVGLESHIGSSAPDWTGYIRQVKALGYKVFITEFDTPSATREPAQTFAFRARAAGVDGFIVWNLVNMPDDTWKRGTPLNYPSMTSNAMYDGIVAGLNGQQGGGKPPRGN